MSTLFAIAVFYVIVAVIDKNVNNRSTAEAAWWGIRTLLKIVSWLMKATAVVAGIIPGMKEPMLRFAEELGKFKDWLKKIHTPK